MYKPSYVSAGISRNHSTLKSTLTWAMVHWFVGHDHCQCAVQCPRVCSERRSLGVRIGAGGPSYMSGFTHISKTEFEVRASRALEGGAFDADAAVTSIAQLTSPVVLVESSPYGVRDPKGAREIPLSEVEMHAALLARITDFLESEKEYLFSEANRNSAGYVLK